MLSPFLQLPIDVMREPELDMHKIIIALFM
jgi:hypothetical protein